MKIIIAPDKFKGSLTAFEVCQSIGDGIRNIYPQCEIISLPMADGGDGFSSLIQYYLYTETVNCDTVDPLLRPTQANYQWDKKNNTAIIELAAASGLVLLKEKERNPLLTSTYGTGLLVKDAIKKGARNIILGIGGSATNDGGTGILSALGFRFLDENEQELIANGENLAAIKQIVVPLLPTIAFEIACDVRNVLYGSDGASFIYAPQKGANPQQVEILDKGMMNLAEVLYRQTCRQIAHIPGSGAAGGIAASLLSFFDAKMMQGVDMIIDISGFKQLIQNTDLVITGEGRIDHQSLEGKVIGIIASLAHEKNVPVIAFCGKMDLNADQLQKTGLAAAYAIGESVPLEESMKNAAILLTEKSKEVIKGFFRTSPR
jgi:glycerate kinase